MVRRRRSSGCRHGRLAVPADRQLVGDLGQHLVAGRIAPQDQVGRSDVGLGDGTVVLDLRLAAKLLPPMVSACVISAAAQAPIFSFNGLPVGRTIRKLSMKASSMGPCRPWRLRNVPSSR